MTENLKSGGLPIPRKKYTSAFKAECVRQVAAGAWQTDVARAQGISSALLGRWQRRALEQAVASSAKRDEIKRRRTELTRVEMARDMLKTEVMQPSRGRRQTAFGAVPEGPPFGGKR